MEDIKQFFRLISALIVFIQNNFKAVILVLIIAAVVLSSPQPQQLPNLYRIDLYGPIMDAEEFLREVRAANEEHIKGVLLVVDSPGGSVPPSVEMMMAIDDLAGRKPVVAYSAGVMASGSYYASIWADTIIANPGSIIGSIGVMMEGVNAQELLDKIGVQMRVVKAGELKEAGAFYREWTKIERDQLESLTRSIYEMFVADVAAARGLEVEDAPKFANGRVFTAAGALEVGLIDEVGNIQTAEQKIVELSAVDNPIWNQKSDFDKFIKALEQHSQTMIGKIFAPKLKMEL